MTNPTQLVPSKAFDSAGIVLSGMCVAHCLVLPIAVSLLPVVIGDALLHPAVHWGMLATVVPIALFALLKGYRSHKELFVLVAGAAGLLGLCAAHPLAHALGGHHWETILTVAGGVLLTSAHVRNLWACHQCGQDCHRQ
ncbi:MerC domain-containing protein [Persicimonas caeni]|uniref:MerC domain-containing protein n=1 Tax=Persicimonas caeni TaxID=2292766 RepID=A0A4Y6PZD0_PERCE|nr:MerC domain-containing protein [Persicimonas caeni]QDG53105.1 MerC domain-containing protein [Persicimonas caeni]QED34327.1 MerC domain-containing protein [Persicimonas caeni]